MLIFERNEIAIIRRPFLIEVGPSLPHYRGAEPRRPLTSEELLEPHSVWAAARGIPGCARKRGEIQTIDLSTTG